MANYIRKTKDVNLSPKLIGILEKISNKSEIAKMLLRTKLSKDDLVDEPIDYLSVSKEDPTRISYIYSEKLDKVNPEELWTSKGRVNAKPAVAIKKFLRNVSEKDLDIFTSLYKAAVSNKEFDLSVISGPEIKKYYGYRSYNDQIGGTLHNSCMKHDGCSEFFDVYIDNPEICRMLIMLDQRGKLMGRALLWNAIDTENGKDILVMDRIYAVDDNKNMHYFKDWADENGYIYKKEQKWQNCLFFESHGKSKLYKIAIKVKKKAYFRYPYVDTFKFWNEKESTLNNFLPEKDNGYIRTLMGNDGRTLSADTLALDIVQKMYMHREHLIYLPYLDGRTHADYTIWSETMETSIARDHAIYSEEIHDYIFNEDFKQFNNQIRFNARKEQIRRMNECNAKKMVSSKKARLSSSTIYDRYYAIDDDYDAYITPAVQPVVTQAQLVAEPIPPRSVNITNTPNVTMYTTQVTMGTHQATENHNAAINEILDSPAGAVDPYVNYYRTIAGGTRPGGRGRPGTGEQQIDQPLLMNQLECGV